MADGVDKKLEKEVSASISDGVLDNGDVAATQHQRDTLRHISDSLPISAWLVVIVEFAERFSYYGTTGPFTNYIQQPLPPGSTTGAVPSGQSGVAGALDQGQQTSFALTTFNRFFIYTMPILGAILADTKWGRLKAIWIFSGVCLLGHIILVVMAAPTVLEHPNGALGGFIISLLIMGIGTGGVKANVSPLVAEQYTKDYHIRTLKSGEQVVVSPAMTVSKTYLWFYWMINAGSLASLGTSYAAKDVGFWLAYLIPTLLFVLIPIILYLGRNKYVTTPPRGSVILDAYRVFAMGAKGRWALNPLTLVNNFRQDGFWAAAKPSAHGDGEAGVRRNSKITWDDEFVDEVKRAIRACKVFLMFPFFWIAYDQMSSNLVSQAAAMELGGVPNDILNNLNPITLMICIPIFDYGIYPLLRKYKINFSPIKRITWGFMTCALAMVYSAVVQHYVYKLSPCGNQAASCVDANEIPLPAPMSVWIQAPSYILVGIGEIFASITGLEYAFSMAPQSLRSLVMALFLLQSAFSAALGFALISVAEDPYLVGNYAGVACTAFISGIIFWFMFRKQDSEWAELQAIGKGPRAGFRDAKDDSTDAVDKKLTRRASSEKADIKE